MKQILLLSDTHGYIGDEIIKHAHTVDEIWHAGDIGDFEVTDTLQKIKPLHVVYGNIDNHQIRSQFPLNAIFYAEKVKVLITHIAGYPKRYNPRVKELIQKEKPNLVICGHSHILKVMNDSQYNHLHMNPGAIGIHGFHKKRTMLKFVIDQDQIKDLVVIEFKR